MERIQLVSSAGARLEVLSLGAAVDAWHPAPGTGPSIVASWPVERRLERAQPYAGAVVGRYANRIADARFVLDGTEHRLVPSEGAHTLHGGPDGFDRREWDVAELGADRAVLRLVSPDGDQGFPGTLTATASYTLLDDAVEVVLEATTDAPTVVGLASHPYLELGPDPVLTVPAARYLPVDGTGVPLPGSAAVDGSPFNLRHGRAV
ncbi:MAG: galactose-1-epimerase, partial [Actinomycetales bacterium]